MVFEDRVVINCVCVFHLFFLIESCFIFNRDVQLIRQDGVHLTRPTRPEKTKIKDYSEY